MERKIGETFEYEGEKLKVVNAGTACDGCYFKGKSCDNRNYDITGICGWTRKDNQPVRFIKVTEEQQAEQQQEERPQEVNLCEILKDCPKGTKFWSPIFGDCEFSHLNRYENGFKSITVLVPKHYLFLASNGFNDKAEFNCQGAICDKMNECLLFPSKDQRDWGKWKCPKPRFDPKTLKAFDRVLVKDEYSEIWSCDLFSHLDNDESYKYFTISTCWNYCIPYNDDTKHLVGTTDEAPDFYRYWED